MSIKITEKIAKNAIQKHICWIFFIYSIFLLNRCDRLVVPIINYMSFQFKVLNKIISKWWWINQQTNLNSREWNMAYGWMIKVKNLTEKSGKTTNVNQKTTRILMKARGSPVTWWAIIGTSKQQENANKKRTIFGIVKIVKNKRPEHAQHNVMVWLCSTFNNIVENIDDSSTKEKSSAHSYSVSSPVTSYAYRWVGIISISKHIFKHPYA